MRFWVLVYPAPDIKGIWIAHCLELDLVTQGTSRDDAVFMINDAIKLVLKDDKRRGLGLRHAPAEQVEWTKLQLIRFYGVDLKPARRIKSLGVIFGYRRRDRFAFRMEIKYE